MVYIGPKKLAPEGFNYDFWLATLESPIEGNCSSSFMMEFMVVSKLRFLMARSYRDALLRLIPPRTQLPGEFRRSALRILRENRVFMVFGVMESW